MNLIKIFNQNRFLTLLFNVSLRKYHPIITSTKRNYTPIINFTKITNYKHPICYDTLLNSENFLPNTLIHRNYAKSKDKKSNKGKKKVDINLPLLNEVLDVAAFEKEMQKHIDNLRQEYIKNLSVRSTTGAIDSLPVQLDGKEYTIQELAQIVKKNPKTIVLNMATFPQAIPAVLQTIKMSGMNLNPQQDGTTLYIPIPKVTKEYREGLAKSAKALFIKCRDAIKEVQNKKLRNIKKQENISKDLLYEVQAQLNLLTDKYVAEAEKVFTTKQTELLGKE